MVLLADGVPNLWSLGAPERCGSQMFWGDIEWKRQPDMGQAQEMNSGNKSEDAGSKKMKKMKKCSSLFLSLFVY